MDIPSRFVGPVPDWTAVYTPARPPPDCLRNIDNTTAGLSGITTVVPYAFLHVHFQFTLPTFAHFAFTYTLATYRSGPCALHTACCPTTAGSPTTRVCRVFTLPLPAHCTTRWTWRLCPHITPFCRLFCRYRTATRLYKRVYATVPLPIPYCRLPVATTTRTPRLVVPRVHSYRLTANSPSPPPPHPHAPPAAAPDVKCAGSRCFLLQTHWLVYCCLRLLVCGTIFR